MNKPKYKIVLVDADDTIFDFKKAEYSAFKMTLNSFGKDCTHAEVDLYSEINSKHWKELEKGNIDRETLKYRRFEEWFSLMNFNLDSKAFNKVYTESLGDFGILIEGAEGFLRKLSTYCDIYIITNGLLTSQSRRFENSTIKQYIRKIYISEAIGYSKPAKEFFDYCINDIGEEDRSKYIVLGDSLSSDMQGGRNASLVTCRFSMDGIITNSPLCDYEITDYDSFFDVLEV